MPHFIPLGLSLALAPLAAAAGALLAAAEASHDVGSRHQMAAAHAGCAVKAWALKTIIVLAANLLTGHWWVSGFQGLASWVFRAPGLGLWRPCACGPA